MGILPPVNLSPVSSLQLTAVMKCVFVQELSALMTGHNLTGLAEQLQAAGVSMPGNSLASARSTSSVGSSKSGSLSSVGSSRRTAAQRTMRLSTGSIG